MLKIDNLHFRYSGRAPSVLNGVSLELYQGEVGILLGKNGSGKTTLFKNILGIERRTEGSILFEGQDLSALSRREQAQLIAYVPQDIRFGALCVFESIMLGRVAHFGLKAGPEDYAAVSRIIEEMGLADYAYRNVDELSGGERQKIAIARALAQDPKLMIFDEPTGNLDIANEQLILSEARRLAREKNIAILSSLHDLNQALYFGDRFFFLKDGIVKYTGGKDCVTESVIKDIFDVDVQIIEVKQQKIILGGYQNEVF